MADLLTLLGQLQTRFAPFLATYQNFMRTDPEVAPYQFRSTQLMVNRVSEVMHFLSHAYHSLSDIIVRVRTQPPRALLCRPILIQHSAVVQTGIPIQVEAQINLSAQPSTTQAQPQQQNGAGGTASAPAGTGTSPPTGLPAGPQLTPAGFIGLPFLPGTMRVQTFPVEIRALRTAPSTPRTQNNNNNTMNAPVGLTPANNVDSSIPSGGDVTAESEAQQLQNETQQTQSETEQLESETQQSQSEPQEPQSEPPPAEIGNQQSQGNSAQQESVPAPSLQQQQSGGVRNAPTMDNIYNLNNPNVEFFMEVTPEGITIDSLETTLVGSNQASDCKFFVL